ncbi:MAG: hypothetical protein L3J24_10335 [Xanthomonadales bacterium]|nr:hypothetical protein [Xanthomonadales bacterium]
MSKLNSLLVIFLLGFSLTLSAGQFRVNGDVIGDSSVIGYISANYQARSIDIVTNGSVSFSRIDESVDMPGEQEQQQQLVVDGVVIGSSDLITWFLINPNNGNVRLKTNGNLEIIVEQPARNPQITGFSADSSTITEGDQLTLTWDSTDTDFCEGGEDFSFAGQLATQGSETFTENSAGNRSYQITCYAESNGTTFEAISAISVTVEEQGGGGGPTGIDSFTASSPSIAQGEPVTLSWQTTGMNFCRGLVDFNVPGNFPANSSSTFNESRFGLRTYVLECLTANSESFRASINVNVESGNGTGTDPKIRSFVASKSQALVAEEFTLSWDAINVDSCSASGDWSGSKSIFGSQITSFSQTGSRTFTLSCVDNGTGIAVNRTISVNIVNQNTGPGVAITSFSASPNPVQVGADLTLTWTAVNAVSCKGMSPGIGNWIDILPTNSAINVRINTAGDKTFVLRCFEKNNTSVFVDSAVAISTTGIASPPVTTTMSVNTPNIVEGDSVVFSWSSTSASSCVTTGIPFGWAGQSVAISGSMSFTPRHDAMSLSYGIRCSNATSTHTANVSVFSALPAQGLDNSNCAIPHNTIINKEWSEVWTGTWPNPNSRKETLTLNQGENLAIHFKTGTVTGVEAWLTSAPSTSTAGNRTSTITECPGDYTYGQTGSASTPMDSDCIETWGVGTFLKYVVNDTYTPNNGICELKTDTDYYMNIRFSSACDGLFCKGIFDYNRIQ